VRPTPVAVLVTPGRAGRNRVNHPTEGAGGRIGYVWGASREELIGTLVIAKSFLFLTASVGAAASAHGCLARIRGAGPLTCAR
jgi:hypothetical protein